MILALSRIWNANPKHLLHGNKSIIHKFCGQMKMEDANPRLIRYLSNMTEKRIELFGKSTLKMTQTSVEVIGLDDSIDEITMICIPELESMVLGKNLLKN